LQTGRQCTGLWSVVVIGLLILVVDLLRHGRERVGGPAACWLITWAYTRSVIAGSAWTQPLGHYMDRDAGCQQHRGVDMPQVRAAAHVAEAWPGVSTDAGARAARRRCQGRG
jgi:hypothetical protein